MADYSFDPIGKQTYSLDEKNRVRVPAEIFAKFGDAELVVTPGILGCMCLMPLDTFHEINRPLEEADFYDFELQNKYTEVSEMTKPVERDTQNRIAIPNEILKHFKVVKELVFVAKRKFIEIWPAEHFAKRPVLEGAPDISKAMQELGALMRERAIR